MTNLPSEEKYDYCATLRHASSDPLHVDPECGNLRCAAFTNCSKLFEIAFMTYCRGFSYQRSAYLFSDSALTQTTLVKNSQVLTSFGVNTVKEKYLSVHEGFNKIYQVSPNCFIALTANDIFRALEIIEIFKALYSEQNDVAEIMRLVSQNLEADQKHSQYVGLLIAAPTEAGSQIFHWTSLVRQTEKVEGFRAIGSLPHDAGFQFESMHARLTTTHSMSNQAVFIAMAASLQRLGMSRMYLEGGVGGFVNGAHANVGISEWIKDTAYVVCDYQGNPEHTVIGVNRGGGTGVMSTYTKNILYYLTLDSASHAEAWAEQWVDKIDEVLFSLNVYNWVFYSPHKDIYIIVQSDAPTFTTTVSTSAHDVDCKISVQLAETVTYLLRNESPGAMYIYDNIFALLALEKHAEDFWMTQCIAIATNSADKKLDFP